MKTDKIAVEKAVILVNFKMAFFDAIPNFNYFRADYDRCEEVVDKRLTPVVNQMSESAIDAIYNEICDGKEIAYDSANDSFTFK